MPIVVMYNFEVKFITTIPTVDMFIYINNIIAGNRLHLHNISTVLKSILTF